MPAADKINLLPPDPFESSFVGRFLRWALSVGRYIVIATELVVILSFLARFKLDRDLTDLNEAIAEKQAILGSYNQLESDYRQVYQRLEWVAQLNKQSLKTEEVLNRLSEVTPLDLAFEAMSLTIDEVELQGVAMSEQGLAAFLRALKNSQNFNRIKVSQISSGGEAELGIAFKLTAEMAAGK